MERVLTVRAKSQVGARGPATLTANPPSHNREGAADAVARGKAAAAVAAADKKRAVAKAVESVKIDSV